MIHAITNPDQYGFYTTKWPTEQNTTTLRPSADPARASERASTRSRFKQSLQHKAMWLARVLVLHNTTLISGRPSEVRTEGASCWADPPWKCCTASGSRRASSAAWRGSACCRSGKRPVSSPARPTPEEHNKSQELLISQSDSRSTSHCRKEDDLA